MIISSRLPVLGGLDSQKSFAITIINNCPKKQPFKPEWSFNDWSRRFYPELHLGCQIVRRSACIPCLPFFAEFCLSIAIFITLTMCLLLKSCWSTPLSYLCWTKPTKPLVVGKPATSRLNASNLRMLTKRCAPGACFGINLWYKRK